jgi:hypothetical protein
LAAANKSASADSALFDIKFSPVHIYGYVRMGQHKNSCNLWAQRGYARMCSDKSAHVLV